MSAPNDLLRRVPLFAELDDKHLSRLADEFSKRVFSSGDTIATEGEGGRTFFVIENGEAAVSVGGREVGTLGPGASFGEIANAVNAEMSSTWKLITSLKSGKADYQLTRIFACSAKTAI